MPMARTTFATVACANCGRPTSAHDLHPTSDVTTEPRGLCPDCWFDAGKE